MENVTFVSAHVASPAIRFTSKENGMDTTYQYLPPFLCWENYNDHGWARLYMAEAPVVRPALIRSLARTASEKAWLYLARGSVSFSPVQPWHTDPIQAVLKAVRAYHKGCQFPGFKQCAWAWGKLSQSLDYIILPNSADVYHGQILTPDDLKAITGLDIPTDVAWRYVVECD